MKVLQKTWHQPTATDCRNILCGVSTAIIFWLSCLWYSWAAWVWAQGQLRSKSCARRICHEWETLSGSCVLKPGSRKKDSKLYRNYSLATTWCRKPTTWHISFPTSSQIFRKHQVVSAQPSCTLHFWQQCHRLRDLSFWQQRHRLALTFQLNGADHWRSDAARGEPSEGSEMMFRFLYIT